MKAMRLHEQGKPLVLDECPIPEPGTQDVLIKISACAVCRTDLHVCDGDLKQPKLPLIPGHEIVGHVVSCGDEVNDLITGDRVGVPWLGFTCGKCEYCLSNNENLCNSASFTGYHIDGGFAEYTIA
ncbi:MAG: alcohol dehydrogenase catalytic domain-containing protein, partial [Proteobacteria bacterium]|nr:alcohol dehydrogenase catalytic domain-containing protein [Pseudomonadota bacterium]